MIRRLTPIAGFGLVAREGNAALVVLATDERADGIIEAWRRCVTTSSPIDDFSRHLGTLVGPPLPLAMISVSDRRVSLVACGGMEVAWHEPLPEVPAPGNYVSWERITAPGGPERHTLAGEVATLKLTAMGASGQVDPRTHLESGLVHAAGCIIGVSAGHATADRGGHEDRWETDAHDAVVIDGTDPRRHPPDGVESLARRREAPPVGEPVGSPVRPPIGSPIGTARRELFAPVTGGGLARVDVEPVIVEPVAVDPADRPRHHDGLFSPPPPAIVTLDPAPVDGPLSGTSGRILLIDAPAPDLAPLPVADDPEDEITGITEDSAGEMVLGIRCTRDHLNDPDAYYCAQCGIAMVHLTHKLSEGRRPSLGFLVFDDGTAFTVDSEYVIGRAPHDDARVDDGTLRPLAIDDRTRSVSRVHADIKLEGWHVYLVDRNSTNGSYLWDDNSGAWVRLPPGTATRLTPGAHAAIGQRVFHFESPHEQRV